MNRDYQLSQSELVLNDMNKQDAIDSLKHYKYRSANSIYSFVEMFKTLLDNKPVVKEFNRFYNAKVEDAIRMAQSKSNGLPNDVYTQVAWALKNLSHAPGMVRGMRSLLFDSKGPASEMSEYDKELYDALDMPLEIHDYVERVAQDNVRKTG